MELVTQQYLVFDVNDFDETLPGPWEWDLKRLVASTVVAGYENGFSEKRCRPIAISAVEKYGEAMEILAQARTLDVWYYYVDAETVTKAFKRSSKKGLKQVEKMFHKAERKTQEQTLAKLTQIEDGRHLLRRFRMADAALRVGGVGSVGTRCTILLMEGGAEDDAIILQQKEAGPSVLEQYLGASAYESPAQRVVEGQRLMQASSDIFLGWHKSELSGTPFYWRQLKDMKGSMDVELLDKRDFETYVRVCTTCLARAHARGGDAAAIAGYVGGGGPLAVAIADFGFAYADQTLKDHQALQEAIDSGWVEAKTGI